MARKDKIFNVVLPKN